MNPRAPFAVMTLLARTLRRAFSVLAGLAVLTSAGVLSRAAVPASMAERLRQAVRLPQVDISAGYGFSVEQMTAEDDVPDPRAELARLRGELTGQPSDAARQLRIARLSRFVRDESAWRSASEQAVALYRKRVELQPDDPAALTGLGESLAESGKDSEAESLLRQATRKAPDDWRGWSALGRFLIRDVSLPQSPSAADLDRVPKRLEEARACFDRAVAAGPKQAQPLANRAAWHAATAVHGAMRKKLQGETVDEATVPLTPFTTNAIPDLEAASALAPRDYRLHTAVIWFRILGEGQSANRSRRSDGLAWENLPGSVKDRVRPHLTALENLGDDGDPRIAGGALESLSLVHLVLMQDVAAGPVFARRAIRRDPARLQAWDMLVGMLASNQRFDELQPLLEDRVRTHPDARTHFMLAKVLALRDRWDESARRLGQALAVHPSNPLLRLARACVLLRQKDNEGALAAARSELETVTKLLSGISDPAERSGLALHTGVTSAVLFAIEGNVEDSRTFLKSLGPGARDHPYVKDVLAILGD